MSSTDPAPIIVAGHLTVDTDDQMSTLTAIDVGEYTTQPSGSDT